MINKNQFQWDKALIKECISINQFKRLNRKDKYGDTGFIYCCEVLPEVAIHLLDRNDIDFNIQNENNGTAFMMACEYQPSIAMKMLERNDINFNIQNNDGETGFIFACIWQPELTICMLDNANINTTLKNNNGLTAWDIVREDYPERFQMYKSYLEQKKLNKNTSTKPKIHKSLL